MKLTCQELNVISEGLRDCIRERQALLNSPDAVYPEIKAADSHVIAIAKSLLKRIEQELPKQSKRELNAREAA